MRVDAKVEGPRQSMSWLHTWVSILLGWLLYVVFFTGTLSFFQNEISVWMKPEIHQSLTNQSQQQQLHTALTVLNDKEPNAGSWNIRLPSDRSTTIDISARAVGENPRGRRGGNQMVLDSATGQIIEPRETRGGGFLYRFHFELYGMPRIWGRWIVGVATLFMFVAIISGIITHKKIFKDFFTFRPGKGQRSWLDAHNATAVFALPFHIMITFSGLLLLMYMFMPWAMNSAYQGGREEFFRELNPERFQNQPQQNQQQNQQQGERQAGQQQRSENRPDGENPQRRNAEQQGRAEQAQNRQNGNRVEENQARGNQNATNPNAENRNSENRGERGQGESGRGEREVTPVFPPAPMADLSVMLQYAQSQWQDNPVSNITVVNPNTTASEVEFRATHSDSLLDRNSTPTLKFNGVTGELMPAEAATSSLAPSKVYTLLTWLHMARGVDTALRWLLFLSGVIGTMMVATGLVLWIVKRTPNIQKLGYTPFGHRVVEVLNITSIIGLPIACAGYFWANRFIPAQMAERTDWEIRTFLIVWLLTLTYAMLRKHRQAWLELLALATAMYLFTPIVNFATGGRALWSSVYHGQWVVASFDIVCLILAAIFAYSYYKLKRYQATPPKKKAVKATAKTEQGVTSNDASSAEEQSA
ncbi:MAG: PepSY domain-containing protein [Pseudomonadota bacterium]|nr:PepSY domain-containing protein [Pseudomonadota bacterium]